MNNKKLLNIINLKGGSNEINNLKNLSNMIIIENDNYESSESDISIGLNGGGYNNLKILANLNNLTNLNNSTNKINPLTNIYGVIHPSILYKNKF